MEIRDLDSLAAALRALAEVPSQASAEVSEEISRLIQAEFNVGADPFGNPWQALAESTLHSGRRPPPLTATEAMKASVDVKPMSGSGVSITIDDPAVHHQYGTVRMPARPILPEGGVPASWEKAISTALENAVKRRLGDA